MTDVAPFNQKQNNQVLPPINDPDEINLLEYLYALIKKKWLIIGTALIGIISGYVIAKIKGPMWVAEVVITPKEVESQKVSGLSTFGAFGGLVASQLNFGGNITLDNIKLLLDSRYFNSRLIDKYNLLPELYRYQWPKEYQQGWDSSANDWKTTFKKPDPLEMGAFLKETFLNITVEDNLLTLEVHSRDSGMSFNIANYYMMFLDEDIKNTVHTDAKENVEFLEKQLITIGDPLLREKIQALIADEIEKAMVVSKEAFKVVDPVFLKRKFKEKKLYPIVFGMVLCLVTTVLVILIHAFTLGKQTEENQLLIRQIKKELWLK